MPRQCIFCDRQADTKEDAIPVWLVEALRTGDVVLVTRPGATEKYRQDDVAIRVGVVCGDCNHGWMSRLENRAKPMLLPMIKGEKTTLDADAQQTIASWSVKTAMVFEHTWGRQAEAYWRQTERETFAKEPHVPPGQDTFVRIASYSGGLIAAVRIGSRTLKPLVRPSPIVPRCTVCLLMGKLVLQLDADRWREVTGNLGVAMGDPLRDRAEVIWPLALDRLSWPVHSAMNDTEFDRFTFVTS